MIFDFCLIVYTAIAEYIDFDRCKGIAINEGIGF